MKNKNYIACTKHRVVNIIIDTNRIHKRKLIKNILTHRILGFIS